MSLEQIRWLYTYNHWANARYLEILRGLSEEQLGRHLESSFPSVLATFGHMVGAEWIWLRRWHGESPTAFPDWLEEPKLETIAAVQADVEARRDAFLARLEPAQLAEALTYRNMSGAERTNRLDLLLHHVVNHASYHRGQLATLLRQLGHKPPTTDLVHYAEIVRPPGSPE